MSDMTSEALIAAAQKTADSYIDTTERWNALIDALSVVEDAIRARFNLPPGKTPSLEQEEEFFAAYGYPKTNLNTILDQANRSNDAFVNRLLLGDGGAALQAVLEDICIIPAKVPFLPPQLLEIQTGDGEGIWEEPKFDETRLSKVLDFLRGNEIKLDQIILRPGLVDPTKMRQRPYTIVEVLPWNIQIGVCPQIGNALYVTPTILSIYDWAITDKELLVNKFGAQKISMSDNWRDRLQLTVDRFLGSAPLASMLIETIRARQQEAQTGKVPFTDEMRADYLAERERTGIGARKIYKTMTDPPDGLTVPMIESWAGKRSDREWYILNVRADYFTAVMACYP